MLIGFVPARGGSRGLPGKNLALVGGRSLVGRAVTVGRQVAAIHEVVVSSDSEDILEEGARWGATPAPRRAELAADETPTLAVLRDYLDQRTDVQAVVLLQPTSPLRVASDVEACIAALGSARTAVSVVPVDHPPEWVFRLEGGRLAPVLGWERLVSRRQDAQPAYTVNGAVYVADADHIRGGGALLEPGTVAVPMPKGRSVDVDDAVGLLVCNALAREPSAT